MSRANSGPAPDQRIGPPTTVDARTEAPANCTACNHTSDPRNATRFGTFTVVERDPPTDGRLIAKRSGFYNQALDVNVD